MHKSIAITPVPAFSDNYLWVLDNGQNAIVVDPGDAKPILDYLTTKNLTLDTILVTHHHADHIGGVEDLKKHFKCQVIGPLKESIPEIDIRCQQDDQITIDTLDLSFKVLDVPGHTAGHIAYFAAASERNDNLLFCGDTLFSAGCGRLFEGTAEQMWHSLSKFLLLPEDTQIFPAHEYTLSNLNFAMQVEPENQQLQNYWQDINRRRQLGEPSLPAILEVEKQVNPFLRVEQPQVIQAAKQKLQRQPRSSEEVFATIRQWKDIF